MPEGAAPDTDTSPSSSLLKSENPDGQSELPKVKFLFLTMDCRGLHLRVDDAMLAAFAVAEAYTGLAVYNLCPPPRGPCVETVEVGRGGDRFVCIIPDDSEI